MTGEKLLLHACCAPCAAQVCEILESEYNVTLFFCNPNIAPKAEYGKRLLELENYAGPRGLRVIEFGNEPRRWTAYVKEFRREGERSERCRLCYRYRLERTFEYAGEHGFGKIATTLSISPHKDAAMINETGKELGSLHGVSFLEADFKKNDGFKRSVELSKKLGFYRQNYCGCAYSREERKKSSSWVKMIGK